MSPEHEKVLFEHDKVLAGACHVVYCCLYERMARCVWNMLYVYRGLSMTCYTVFVVMTCCIIVFLGACLCIFVVCCCCVVMLYAVVCVLQCPYLLMHDTIQYA